MYNRAKRFLSAWQTLLPQTDLDTSLSRNALGTSEPLWRILSARISQPKLSSLIRDVIRQLQKYDQNERWFIVKKLAVR